MTVAGWDDIRGATSGGRPAAYTPPGPVPGGHGTRPAGTPSSTSRPGQLAGVAARAATRRAALPLATQLTAGGLVVAGGVGGAVHKYAVDFLLRQHWVASGPARAILTWPSSNGQVATCLVGAACLLAAIIATAGMRQVSHVGGCALLVAGTVTFAGLLPLLIVAVMYLVIGALLLALIIAVAIGGLMLLFAVLADS